jgi:prefoldin subunit 5
MTDSDIQVIKNRIQQLEGVRDKLKEDHAIVFAQIEALKEILNELASNKKDRTSAVGM